MYKRAQTLIACVAATTMIITACGSDDATSSADGTDATPATASGTEGAANPSTPSQTVDATGVDTTKCDPDGVTLLTKHLSNGEPAVAAAKNVMEAKYPGLTVEVGTSTASAYDELTQQIVADIAGGRDLDVVMAGNSQIRFFIDTYAPAPLDTSKLRDTYDQRFLNVGTIDGEVYMAPFQVSIPSLFYNKDLMAEAGLDPEAPPSTFSELLAAATAMQDVTSAGAFYAPTESIADWVVQSAVQSAGGTFVAEDGTAGFDTPEGRAGIGLYSDMAAQGLIDPVGLGEGQTAFTTGATGMYISSSAGTAGLAASIGDSFDWGVVAMPIADGGAPAYPAGGNGWVVLTDDPCRAAFASELVGEMLAPEVLVEALKVTSYIPVDTEAREILLADTSYPEQQRFGYAYEGDVTPWGGWPGDSAPEANQLVSDMVLRIVQGDDPDSNITSTVDDINSAVS